MVGFFVEGDCAKNSGCVNKLGVTSSRRCSNFVQHVFQQMCPFCRESVKVTFDKKEEGEPEGDGEIKDDDDEGGEVEDQEKKVVKLLRFICKLRSEGKISETLRLSLRENFAKLLWLICDGYFLLMLQSTTVNSAPWLIWTNIL